MAQTKDRDEIDWIKPHFRACLPIEDLHIPRRLKDFIRTKPFKITADKAFKDVIRSCAAITNERRDTWINEDIIHVFCNAHAAGLAHSVEVWDKEDKLIGGVYGLSLGAAFFAESMFSRQSNASKVALVHLADILKRGEYEIFDVQFHNPHLEQFGVFEIPHDKYDAMLAKALKKQTIFKQ